MSLPTLLKVQKLQAALHAKAKGWPGYRFYALYDKGYRADVLEEAYERCRKNGGAAGVDGQTFEDIEAYGVQRWLGELAQELRDKRYRPHAVRRVYIPKPDGKQRPSDFINSACGMLSKEDTTDYPPPPRWVSRARHHPP